MNHSNGPIPSSEELKKLGDNNKILDFLINNAEKKQFERINNESKEYFKKYIEVKKNILKNNTKQASESEGIGEGNKNIEDSPESPNASIEELKERLTNAENSNINSLGKINEFGAKILSHDNLIYVLLIGLFFLYTGIWYQYSGLLPSYREDYVRATENQNNQIELLKKDNEKLSSDNDDLKKELLYLRARFDKYIDTNKSQEK